MAEENELRYDPAAIEKKWQERWAADPKLYAAEPASSGKPKYYVLEMLPYPSGQLHMGHVRNYAIGDALARQMWMRGYNVLHPMGWDAFGLPAENAALKNNTPPREWTLANIAAMKRQMQRLGLGYDWATEVTTCLPDYYRWNQWFFLRMYEKGLVYRKKSKVNWCPECATVLANEQVVDGCCWRHEDTKVEQRDLEQWFFRITAYAQELLDGLDKLDGWPEKVRTMQRNWIGRSEGTEVDFFLEEINQGTGNQGSGIRKDSAFACLPRAWTRSSARPACSWRRSIRWWQLSAAADAKLKAQVAELLDEQKKAREAGDVGAIEKHGVPTGRFAINPYNGERVPIWVANYILMDYGTGAIMSVPGHDERDFEFATKYGIEIRQVIKPVQDEDGAKLPFISEDGVLVNSGEYNGLSCAEAQKRLQEVAADRAIWRSQGHLSLEGLGREPPALLGHADPHDSLRARRPGSRARRSVAGDPARADRDHAAGRLAAGPRAGVCEHHLPQMRRTGAPRNRHHGYLRRFELVLLPLHRREELHGPVRPGHGAVLVSHRPVHRRRGARHSAPDLLALLDQGDARPGPGEERRAGAASLHAGHGHQGRRQDVEVEGQRGLARRHGGPLRRRRHAHVRAVCRAARPRPGLAGRRRGRRQPLSGPRVAAGRRITRSVRCDKRFCADCRPKRQRRSRSPARARLHQTIAKITLDFEGRWHFNTCVAAIMELVNELQAADAQLAAGEIPAPVVRELLRTLVLLLAPFAPFLAAELWEQLGEEGAILRAPWPKSDPELAKEDEIEIPVQINGKLVAVVRVAAGADAKTMEAAALADEKVRARMAGKTVVKVIVVPGRAVNLVVK